SLSDNAADLGQLEAAERYARKAREISPSSTAAIESLAVALIRQGKTEDASTLVEQTLQLYPQDTLMQSLEGSLAYLAGDYDKTLTILRKTYPSLFEEPAQIDDGNPIWWGHNLAWVYRVRGDVDESDALLAAIHRRVEPRLHVYPTDAPDWLGARTAAVLDDREALERHLRNMARTGAGFGSFLHDPMFLQYRDDPAIAAVFDEMRESDRQAREQLAAEGVF
ncbi:MAG: tetratricopeptide repeat protein, partial [Chromatiales bacterium]|nr:tetratricopeptide repeat protein [Chromatiales bacterium]